MEVTYEFDEDWMCITSCNLRVSACLYSVFPEEHGADKVDIGGENFYKGRFHLLYVSDGFVYAIVVDEVNELYPPEEWTEKTKEFLNDNQRFVCYLQEAINLSRL